MNYIDKMPISALTYYNWYYQLIPMYNKWEGYNDPLKSALLRTQRTSVELRESVEPLAGVGSLLPPYITYRQLLFD